MRGFLLMKQDWNLTRELLIAIEEERAQSFCSSRLGDSSLLDGNFVPDNLANDKVKATHFIIKEHLQLLMEAGLIERARWSETYPSYSMQACRLTAKGHEALNAMRNQTMWGEIKNTAVRSGVGLSISLLGDFARHAAKKLIENV